MLAIFEAKVMADLVSGLGMGPSEASKVARCAAADWNSVLRKQKRSPRFEPMSNYEKWLARPLAVLPASDLLSFVYEKCEQIRRGSDNPRSRKKP